MISQCVISGEPFKQHGVSLFGRQSKVEDAPGRERDLSGDVVRPRWEAMTALRAFSFAEGGEKRRIGPISFPRMDL